MSPRVILHHPMCRLLLTPAQRRLFLKWWNNQEDWWLWRHSGVQQLIWRMTIVCTYGGADGRGPILPMLWRDTSWCASWCGHSGTGMEIRWQMLERRAWEMIANDSLAAFHFTLHYIINSVLLYLHLLEINSKRITIKQNSSCGSEWEITHSLAYILYLEPEDEGQCRSIQY